MITQMQHQDPTSPFKAEQMAQEMAQFTSVEQMQNMNRSLEKMSSKDQPLERMAMTNLIGKTVTVDRGRIPHQDGNNESLVFNLPRNASEVKIALISEQGEVVLEKDLGKQKSGENSFSWDGLKSNSLPAKSGNYLFRVEAKDELGRAIDTGAQAKARVVGISFEGSEPVFLVGDAKNQTRVTMKNIVRIDDDSVRAYAAPGGGAPVAAEPKEPSFIAFKKGEGSSNLDSSAASPEVAEALARYQAENAANPASAQSQELAKNPALKTAQAQTGADSASASEKGFPNGLQD
jgi:flagellar hook assembly protein FlgD